jgi:hypothetical protein
MRIVVEAHDLVANLDGAHGKRQPDVPLPDDCHFERERHLVRYPAS